MDIITNNPIYKLYHLINYDLQDLKTEHLPLLKSPLTLLTMLVIYNFGCLKYGPRLMAKRKPFELRNAIIAFDIMQVVFNTYLILKIISIGITGHYNFLCAPIDTEDTPVTRDIAFHCYCYFLLKMSDMMDTIFMVLKKKIHHVSFLHMYHHTGMIILSYSNAKYMPGGHHICLGMYNTLVHSVMYTYYLCAALYPNANLYHFKKLVTKLQMFQFGLICIHMSTVLLIPNCRYPSWVLFIVLPNTFLMFILFYDFYRKTYVLKKKKVT